MTVTLAKSNLVRGARTFYVTSETEPGKKYIVVLIERDGHRIPFCQCTDCFARKLPFVFTNQFSHCKHGAAVIEAIGGDK
jgi:hypothetical protein